MQKSVSRGIVLALLAASGCKPPPEKLVRASYGGNLEEVDKLIARGADVNAAAPDWHGRTPLQAAIEGKRTAVVARLLAAGADARALDNVHLPLLDSAARRDESGEIVLALIEHGADPNQLDKLGETALGAAAWNNKVGSVRVLLDHGADVNGVESAGGWTALHRAAQNGAVGAAQLLLDRGAHIDAQLVWQNRPSSTALHLAAEAGHLEMVRLLLQRGANRALVDDKGLTPREVAILKGHRELVNEL